MLRSSRVLAVSLGVVAALLLAGCGSDGDSGGADSASQASEGGPLVGGIAGSIGGEGPAAAPAAPAGGSCAVAGRYTVTTITPKDAVRTAIGRLQVTGGQGIRVEFTDDGNWSLTDDGSQPVTLAADGHHAEGRLVGRIAGRYAADGTGYRFEQTEADGEIRITSTLGNATLPMGTVGPALAPSGAVALTCTDAGVTVSSENVTLALVRAG